MAIQVDDALAVRRLQQPLGQAEHGSGLGQCTSVARTTWGGVERKLPMADSVMLATAQAHGATLWTQDADFEEIAGVQYIARQ